ncbi:periplasmic heavy metal sensor [Acerihabitans sp. TG2]|uniref:periplasmic heavy metal sensor n=1 Tax=Acerihabitans sp. TG2 TaxID=3096008 RepID=UPI002B233CE7|nr:periplasmic heavy metal sensor [Acerihabitans sp. TG2]MEA9390113.1 periplasmic heavy metal sensor [Acerihabitans sp. TG2]
MMKIAKRNVIATTIAVVSLLGVIGGVSAAPAQAPVNTANSAPGYMMGTNAVTPEQQRAFNEHYKAVALLQQQILAKQAEMNVLYYGNNPDQAKINTLTKELGDLNAKLYSEQGAFRAQLVKSGVPCEGGGYGMMNRGGGYGMMEGNGGGYGMMGY